MKNIIMLFVFAFSILNATAQNFDFVINNGQTISTNTGTLSPGAYSADENYKLTICSDNEESKHVNIEFNSISFQAGDVLCAYDGEHVNDPLIACINFMNEEETIIIEAGETNSSGCITLSFQTQTENSS